MRKFNLIQLYENLVSAARDLKDIATSKDNASYSAMSSFSIVENAIKQIPAEVAIMIGRKNAGLPVDESKLNPSIKYVIAESVYNALNGSFLVPAKTLCSYIKSTMEYDKWGYVGSKVMESCAKKSSNNMYAALYKQVNDVLLNDDVYESLKKVACDSEFWCNESKQVIALMESEEYKTTNKITKTVVENNCCSMVKMFTPFISENNRIVFNLYGKNYALSNGKILETHVSNERYNNVVNGLSLMSYNAKENTLDYYGANGKILEYKIDENRICIGNNDLTDLPSLDLRDNLSISGLFNKGNVNHIDTLVKMFESRDMITELDNCINLRSDVNAGVFLSIISVDEGFYVNSVNYNNYTNEMKFFKSATAAKNYIKESINYDATNVLREALKAEGDKNAAIMEERSSIQERIDFLKQKRGEIVSKIESTPKNIDTTSLVEALNLLECEIKDNEIALCSTYSTDTCGNNCVPVKVANLVGTLVPGDIVYVDAAAFAEAPEYTTISVTDPKTGSSVVVNKSDLIFDINHDTVVVDDNGVKVVDGGCKCCDNGTCKCDNGTCDCKQGEKVIVYDCKQE